MSTSPTPRTPLESPLTLVPGGALDMAGGVYITA
jgi:hypothetical protein